MAYATGPAISPAEKPFTLQGLRPCRDQLTTAWAPGSCTTTTGTTSTILVKAQPLPLLSKAPTQPRTRVPPLTPN